MSTTCHRNVPHRQQSAPNQTPAVSQTGAALRSPDASGEPARWTVWRRAQPLLGVLLVAGLLPDAGCVSEEFGSLKLELTQLRRSFDDFKRTSEAATYRIGSIEQSIHMLACGPELRSLFRNIQMACSTAAAQNCSKSQLRTPLASFKMDASEPVGPALMTTMRHEVVYPATKSEMSATRMERLESFAQDAMKSQLTGTHYLLVTAPVPNEVEATRRAQAVEEVLVKRGLQREKFVPPWIYKLFEQEAQWKKFALVDQPLSTETKDLGRAVFVFRVSCFGGD